MVAEARQTGAGQRTQGDYNRGRGGIRDIESGRRGSRGSEPQALSALALFRRPVKSSSSDDEVGITVIFTLYYFISFEEAGVQFDVGLIDESRVYTNELKTVTFAGFQRKRESILYLVLCLHTQITAINPLDSEFRAQLQQSNSV